MYLMGVSLGGGVALDAMFHAPGLFEGAVMLAPFVSFGKYGKVGASGGKMGCQGWVETGGCLNR